ncbi:MAG: DUF4286 family protein [Ginsengibacter sp.]|jgi:hypothetical protein
MYIHNTTTKVDHETLEEWLRWQKKINIPEIMASGYVNEYHFCQLLGHDETDGKTFTLQLLCTSKNDYEGFLKNTEPLKREEATKKWGDHAVYFSSLLKSVD